MPVSFYKGVAEILSDDTAVSIGNSIGVNYDIFAAQDLLRSVGGRMYLPGPSCRVASDGSGATPVNGDVIGWIPDRVTGANAATQATTELKPKQVREPILGPELVVNGSGDDITGWTPTNCTVASVGGEFVITATAANNPKITRSVSTIAGKTYQLTTTQRQGTTAFSATSNIQGNALTLSMNSTTTSTTYTRNFTATGTSVVILYIQSASAVIDSTAIFDNISIKEILGYPEYQNLVFDENDVLTSGSPLLNNSNFTLVSAMTKTQSSAFASVSVYGATTFSNLSYTSAAALYCSDDSGYTVSVFKSSIPVGATNIVSGIKEGPTFTLRMNGSYHNSTDVPAFGSQTFTGMKIGGGAGGKVSFLAIAPVALSVEQIKVLERAAAQVSGVTLL